MAAPTPAGVAVSTAEVIHSTGNVLPRLSYPGHCNAEPTAHGGQSGVRDSIGERQEITKAG